MNPLNIYHIKIKKANAIKLRYQKVRKITNFFRIFEIFLVFAVISRISFQIPLSMAFKLSNEYFHSLSLILVSPQFVFIVGNAIVITLFVNSGHLNSSEVKRPKSPPTNDKRRKKKLSCMETGTCTQTGKETGMENGNPTKFKGVFGGCDVPDYPKGDFSRTENGNCCKLPCIIGKKTTKKQEKTEETSVTALVYGSPENQVVKIYDRSKSERSRREKMEKGCCGLRRSKTEINGFKSCGCCKDAGEGHYPEDHMSNEEFRKTIEDFIAKQQRFLRQEEDFSDLLD